MVKVRLSEPGGRVASTRRPTRRSSRSDWRAVPDRFARRHIGPSPEERNAMLDAVGAASIDALIDEAIPPAIRLGEPLNLLPAETEQDFLRRLTASRARKLERSAPISASGTTTRSPRASSAGWCSRIPGGIRHTRRTRRRSLRAGLESLLNFQTMVADLTAMEVANGLLDEATAAAEAMTLLQRVHLLRRRLQGQAGRGGERRTFLVSDRCFPQTLEVLRSGRAARHRAQGRFGGSNGADALCLRRPAPVSG